MNTVNQAFRLPRKVNKILYLNDYQTKKVLEDEILRLYKDKRQQEILPGETSVLKWKKLKDKTFTQRSLSVESYNFLLKLEERLELKKSKICTLILYNFASRLAKK